ncbi:glycosyltransferase family 2 protein [Streptomyces sp. NPDC006385]|uniref:glycosyltransferase family 2 protein n=1 Tax=Streptomyces sp. NPDC006385 TaxID=3156761 RepID=UPI0033ACB7B3
MPASLSLLIAAVSMTVIAFGLTYFFALMLLGAWRLRPGKGRHRRPERSARADREPDSTPPPAGFHLYFLVPCLNESAVIAPTVSRLAEIAGSRVIVIDDASDDGTGERCQALGSSRVHVLRRELPDARLGKGPALNAGFRHLVLDVHARGLDPETVLVCVMDADGRLSPGAVDHVTACFADPRVGGVQLAVRIRNRDRLITRFQDMEFWALSAISQHARVPLACVSLGGNGQFVRLRALLELEGPWPPSLTEDLDLTISLLVGGWSMSTTPHAWVDQQGVDSWRRLVRQRTRWYQGTMTATGRLGEVWSSTCLRRLAVLELTCYLLIPWVLVLPWSILGHINLVLFGVRVADGRTPVDVTAAGWASVAFWVFFYLLSCAPNITLGCLYFLRDRGYGLARSVALGHLLLLTNYVTYLATWLALVRMLRGQTGWAKTSRAVETTGGAA